MKRFMFWLVLGVLLSGFSPWISAGSVTNFSAPTLDGGTFRMSDHLGKKVILVDFWASKCTMCKKFLLKAQALQEQFKDKDFLVLGIAVDPSGSKNSVEQYVKGKNITLKIIFDPDMQIFKMFNPSCEIPFGVVIDQNGKIAFSHSGYTPGDEAQYEKVITKLLNK